MSFSMTVSASGCSKRKRRKREKTLELINCLCYNAIQSENKRKGIERD